MTPPLQRELTVLTPDDVSVVISREFAAPPERVWEAHTEPRHLRRWLGRADFPLTTCEMDVRVGGRYRWVFSRNVPDQPAQTMGVSGEYTDVVHPVRLVALEQFDDFPGPGTNTMVLEELDGDRTAMTLTVSYPDRSVRDGWLESGMTDGMAEGYRQLDEVLAELSGELSGELS